MQERRSSDEETEMGVAKAARIRVHEVDPKHAGTDLAGSVVGRLFLAGDLEPEQLSAARLFADTYAAYQRAVDSPRPPKAVSIDGVSGRLPPEVTPERANQARSQWGSITGVLQVANNAHRGAAVYAACDYIVLRDLAMPHLIPDLRLGLNAIAQAYGLKARAA